MGTINGVVDDVLLVMSTLRLIVKQKIYIRNTHLHELDTQISMGNKNL